MGRHRRAPARLMTDADRFRRQTKESTMSVARTVNALATGTLLAAALPAMAEPGGRWEHRGWERDRQERSVEHRRGQRPVMVERHVERRVVVQRPVVVERPV